MELKDYEYRTGDMSAYICVEKYLLHHGFKKTVAELQSYKPLIVYDYLKKNGYENRSQQMAEVFLEKSTKMKRKPEALKSKLNLILPREQNKMRSQANLILRRKN